MLERAWRRGEIERASWVVEAFSCATSLALALACAQLDLRFLAVMPQGVSNDGLLVIRAYAGEVLMLDKGQGMAGAIHRVL